MTSLFTLWADTHQPTTAALQVIKAYQCFLITCEFNRRYPSQYASFADPNQPIKLVRAEYTHPILLPTTELLPVESLTPCAAAVKAAAEMWLEEDFADYDRHQPLFVAVHPCPRTHQSLTCLEYFTL